MTKVAQAALIATAASLGAVDAFVPAARLQTGLGTSRAVQPSNTRLSMAADKPTTNPIVAAAMGLLLAGTDPSMLFNLQMHPPPASAISNPFGDGRGVDIAAQKNKEAGKASGLFNPQNTPGQAMDLGTQGGDAADKLSQNANPAKDAAKQGKDLAADIKEGAKNAPDVFSKAAATPVDQLSVGWNLNPFGDGRGVDIAAQKNKEAGKASNLFNPQNTPGQAMNLGEDAAKKAAQKVDSAKDPAAQKAGRVAKEAKKGAEKASGLFGKAGSDQMEQLAVGWNPNPFGDGRGVDIAAQKNKEAGKASNLFSPQNTPGQAMNLGGDAANKAAQKAGSAGEPAAKKAGDVAKDVKKGAEKASGLVGQAASTPVDQISVGWNPNPFGNPQATVDKVAQKNKEAGKASGLFNADNTPGQAMNKVDVPGGSGISDIAKGAANQVNSFKGNNPADSMAKATNPLQGSNPADSAKKGADAVTGGANLFGKAKGAADQLTSKNPLPQGGDVASKLEANRAGFNKGVDRAAQLTSESLKQRS